MTCRPGWGRFLSSMSHLFETPCPRPWLPTEGSSCPCMVSSYNPALRPCHARGRLLTALTSDIRNGSDVDQLCFPEREEVCHPTFSRGCQRHLGRADHRQHGPAAPPDELARPEARLPRTTRTGLARRHRDWSWCGEAVCRDGDGLYPPGARSEPGPPKRQRGASRSRPRAGSA